MDRAMIKILIVKQMPHICRWIISRKADRKSFANGHVKTPRSQIYYENLRFSDLDKNLGNK